MPTFKPTGLRPAALPTLEHVHSTDPATARAWQQVRTILETRFGKSGRKLDKAVTWYDLLEAGFAKLPERPAAPGQNNFDLTPVLPPPPATVADGIPPAPSGLVVSPAMATIILEWDKPEFAYYGYAEIWRASENNLGQAVMVGQTSAWVYADALPASGGDITWWYWIRYISIGGKVGPYNAVSGTSGAWEPPDAVPPAPTGLTTTDALASIILEWDDPDFEYYGHAEIWRASSNDRAQAEKIGQSSGWGYVDHLNHAGGATYWYWIRFVSRGGKIGPWQGEQGIPGTVSTDAANLRRN